MDSDTKNALENYYKLKGEYESKIQEQRKKIRNDRTLSKQEKRRKMLELIPKCINCAKRGVSCDNATAYITHYPCINCMKIMCAAGISEIKYIDDYRNDDMIPYFAKLSNISISKLD